MYRIILLILLLTSCSVYQPLEGLCYTDKKGTYICPKEEWKKDTLKERHQLYLLGMN